MTTANSMERTVDDGAGPYGDAVETVAFLARSEHRVRVLSLLADGPRSRDEITERVEATRVTLSRIFGDLEDRDLIARDPTATTYELTRYGDLVYRDLDRLFGTVSIGRAYPGVVERLPAEWFDFDLRCLADGELVSGDEADPMSAARFVANAVRDATSRKALLGTFLSLPLHTFEESLRTGEEPDGVVIFDADVAETMLDDPNLRERWQGIESITDGPVYHRVDERVPCGVAVHDGETVFLTVDREGGNGFDVIRTTHPDVVEWADRTIDEHRTGATPLAAAVDDRP